jgi:hypothetical protein
LTRPESPPTRRDNEARREPLHIPFKWCRQGLVKIVDIEGETPLGRGEPAEIHEMTVAAGLNDYPALWGAGKVVRLYRGCASKVRKRRLEHPPVANRDQILEPAFVRSLDQRDDVALIALPKNYLAM